MWIYILCIFIILGIIDFIVRKIGAYFEKKEKQKPTQDEYDPNKFKDDWKRMM